VACAAAVATLRVIEEERLVENARTMGARLRAGLQQVAEQSDRMAEVRGLGLMLATEFVTPEGEPDSTLAKRSVARALDEGLLLLTCGPWNNVVRMIPALVVNAEEVDSALAAWQRAVTGALQNA
jgi:4-aminobutyrate aminotransferase